MPKTTTVSAPNLERGIAILEYLATHQRSATIAELSERLDYPSASVFRVAHVLNEMGYLSRDAASKRFSLTNKLLRLGQPQSRNRGLVESAIPAMRGLLKATGETTQLCCLVDKENVVLEQLVSTHPFKYMVDLGARTPCYSCAPGKAMVARLSKQQQDGLISRLTFKKFTSTTISSQRAFRREIQQINEVGFALDRAEGMEGIHCVAAAICDRHGFPVGAMTIAGPSSRIAEADFALIGEIVSQAAAAVEDKYNS